MSTRDLFDTVAAEDSEEEDEDFDDETGEVRSRPSKSNGRPADPDDSSEEDESDDEEAEREVAEGFIVDEEEDEEERKQRRRERKKRRREEAEDDQLDEEDLALIGETIPGQEKPAEQSKFKRLKRGHRDDRGVDETRGVEDIFSDEEDGDEAVSGRRPGAFHIADDLDDFIEEDDFPDEERNQLNDDLEIRQPAARGGFTSIASLRESGYDEADLEDVRDAFGDGHEFEWALETERAREDEEQDPERALELKDVFEPSQLIEKMLTDADNEIRMIDVPERYQLARKVYKDIFDVPEEERAALHEEEADWITDLMFPRQPLEPQYRGAFRQCISQVLTFMNVEQLEPIFIFFNRKDYLIHADEGAASPGANGNGPPPAIKLISLNGLWDVVDHDLKFRAFAEKRDGIRKSIATLKETESELKDVVFDELLPAAVSTEELQDIQDYLNFQYGQQIKEFSIAEAEVNGTQKRAQGTRNVWEKVRSSRAYMFVRSFGITPDAIAQNAAKVSRRVYTEDQSVRPDDFADELLAHSEYSTSTELINTAKAMFTEEIVMSPRMRKFLRKVYFEQVVFDAVRTEKGLKQIDEDHPYYEFKYLRNQDIRSLISRPELFLRMIKAEDEGLIEVKVRLSKDRKLQDELVRCIESDNISDAADAWNALRRETLSTATKKLHRILARSCKETVKNECENSVALRCREAYNTKLDQAPYKPKGMVLGTTPRVFALSNGAGNRADAICWAYVDEHARVIANGKFAELRLGNGEKFQPDSKDVMPFVEEIEKRRPDVIAVSGWSVETRRLYKDLQDIVKKHDLRGTPYDDDGRDVSDELEVVVVNDEVARLYYTSPKAASDHPGVPPLTRYAIALAKYMQDPLKQYAALGRDVASISFDPAQHLIPEDKLVKYLETAMVDNVNLVGVELNDAVNDTQVANLLPYVAGLGPRKAAQMLKVINANGGEVTTREELVGDVENNRRPAVGPRCFVNSGSTLYILFDPAEPEADYLDNTRIHPEDYEIARKMAADALEYDEEDVAAEVDKDGPNAIVRRLVSEEQQDKVNDLLLEQYAEQLETKFGQKKRAILETIRMELQQPFEELRRNFFYLSTNDIFSMLTGDTPESMQEGMVVPVSIKRTFSDHIEVRLDNGIEGSISASEFPDDMVTAGLEPRQFFSAHQTVQAKVMHLDYKKLTAQLTMRDNEIRNPAKRKPYHTNDEWDEDQETKDKREAKKAHSARNDRAQRVIRHPLFHPFNSAQAEAFLADGVRGDCVIRPSSKGLDHLAITWKVNDNLYQHLDVLELDKENEFSVGKVLRVGKSSYSDLDELIFLHVKSMAKKVDEMMTDDKYQSGTKEQTGQWLSTYTEANPKRSMYAFCLNAKSPGYFFLCFKNSQVAPLASWPVKVIPNAYELQGNKYPDMQALKNGFKTLIMNHGMGGVRPAINGRR